MGVRIEVWPEAINAPEALMRGDVLNSLVDVRAHHSGNGDEAEAELKAALGVGCSERGASDRWRDFGSAANGFRRGS